jgi:small-conductance mechanosensitive channel
MEFPSKVLIDVLSYLLPGFITAAIVYNLTPAPRPAPFERVVQALIFTIIVQVFLLTVRATFLLAGRHVRPLGTWTDHTGLVWSVLLASALGLVVAFLANTDRLHFLLRRLKITRQTSYSSEWYGAFCQNAEFVVLHLAGQRRLYGWPKEWPSTPDTGHFVMVMAEWLDSDKRIPLSGVDKVVIRVTDVEMVEMMKPMTEETTEMNNGGSQRTNTAAGTVTSGAH